MKQAGAGSQVILDMEIRQVIIPVYEAGGLKETGKQ
jgi:hypothetical protein